MIEIKEIREVLMAEARRLETIMYDSPGEKSEEQMGYANGIKGAYYLIENYHKRKEAKKKGNTSLFPMTYSNRFRSWQYSYGYSQCDRVNGSHRHLVHQ